MAGALWLVSLLACDSRTREEPVATLEALAIALDAGDTASVVRYVDMDALAQSMADATTEIIRSREPAAAELLDSPDRRVRARALTESSLRQWLQLAPLSPDEPGAPADGALVANTEFLGYGRTYSKGDTAIVERLVRFSMLDTTAVVTVALVPSRRAHWRVVGFPGIAPLVLAVDARRGLIMDQANAPILGVLDTILAARFTATREPLAEWEQYEAHVRVTLQNSSEAEVSVFGVAIAGPGDIGMGTTAHMEVHDGEIRLAPGETRALEFRERLTGSSTDLYRLLNRRGEFRVVSDSVKLSDGEKFSYFGSWSEYVRYLSVEN
jgi:hypothetical protein